jgi:hypothetical protein
MNHTLPYPAQDAAGTTGVYTRYDDGAPQPAPGALLTEDAAQRLLAEMRRDMTQQIDWQVQQALVARRGPSLGEAGLAIGSLAAGAAVTGVLIANSTTLVQGLWGTQSVSHLNILPYVALVWLAVLAVNVIWARRR